MDRKFTHKVIEITMKLAMYGLSGIAAYGILGGLYFAITRGINDFGVYM
tara:strand:- start:3479 stop:3625 length:147 start_codon:yes stop_codon:yes gene_type:complete